MVHYEKEADWIAVLSALHGSTILGDERIAYTAPRDNTLFIVSSGELAPRDAYTGPLMGQGGADALLRRWR